MNQTANNRKFRPVEPAGWERYKRVFDLLLLVVAHIILAPALALLWIGIPLLVWMEDRGPIFFRQQRIGLTGRVFHAMKFRSMRNPKPGDRWLPNTLDNDMRVTKVGKVIRSLSLDELPQILNMWKGDIGWVGPRPLPRDLHDMYVKESADFTLRYAIRPGLTGLAAVYGPRHCDAERRLRYDLLYIKRSSLWLDIRLIVFSGWLALTGQWGKGRRVAKG